MKGCILIDIPKYCDDCDLFVNETGYCAWCVLDTSINVTLGEGEYKKKKRPKRCPITQIDESIPISWLESRNFTLKQQDTTIPINFIIENLIDIWRTENE